MDIFQKRMHDSHTECRNMKVKRIFAICFATYLIWLKNPKRFQDKIRIVWEIRFGYY